MRRGELRWLRIPGEKSRPAVIVSPDFLNNVRDRVLAAPCTSQRIDSVTHTEVKLEKSGIPKPTKIQCQDMAVFMRSDFGDVLRSLTEEELEALDRAIAIATGLWR